MAEGQAVEAGGGEVAPHAEAPRDAGLEALLGGLQSDVMSLSIGQISPANYRQDKNAQHVAVLGAALSLAGQPGLVGVLQPGA